MIMNVRDILNKVMGEKQPTITPQVNTNFNLKLVFNEKKPLPISKDKTKSKKKKILPK